MSGPSVVIDNGTGYTKMGFSGNVEPQYIVPTAVAKQDMVAGSAATKEGLADLDFYIGNEAMAHSSTHTVDYPIRHGSFPNLALTFLCGSGSVAAVEKRFQGTNLQAQLVERQIQLSAVVVFPGVGLAVVQTGVLFPPSPPFSLSYPSSTPLTLKA